VASRVEGKPPDGFELLGVEARPPRVRVRGPESRVNALEKAPTETVLLDGKTEPFVAAQTAIDIRDRRLTPLTAVVDVIVRVGEARVTRRVANVPVRLADGAEGSPAPARATVEVRGPRSVVERLRAEEIALVVEAAEGGAVRARLSLAPGRQNDVELLSTQPAEFRIKKQ
jgi:hypothetical protein